MVRHAFGPRAGGGGEARGRGRGRLRQRLQRARRAFEQRYRTVGRDAARLEHAATDDEHGHRGQHGRRLR